MRKATSKPSITPLLLLMPALFFPVVVFAQGVPWDKLPNVNLRKLSDADKKRATHIMKNEQCYFECADTIYNCVTAEVPSTTALHAAGFVTRQVMRGKPSHQIHDDLLARAKSVHPFESFEIDLNNTPRLGPKNAAVKVVIFADFDCPFCRIVSPMLRELTPTFHGKVAYYFKFFPVKTHGPAAVRTSMEGYAAYKLGKFWEFHDIMYKNFDNHGEDEVIEYAARLGLDRQKFTQLRNAPQTKKAVATSKRAGLKLGIKSTPTIFIDGKRYYGEKNLVEIKDVIEEILKLKLKSNEM